MEVIICRFEEARDDGIVYPFAKRHLVGKRILELGCGEGDRTKLFYTISSGVVGVDLVDNVSRERKRSFQFVLADARKLPFNNDTFDALVSFDVIEHVDDDLSFLIEAFRVCKPGGWLLLGTPNRKRLSNRVMRFLGKSISYPYRLGPETIHLREYTMNELIVLVRKAGFKVINELYVWLGLVGPIDRGLRTIPKFMRNLVQYLLIVACKRGVQALPEEGDA